MPLRRLTARSRSRTANVWLAAILAFTAGLVDVLGYLALGHFTSHMTGDTATLAMESVNHTMVLLTRSGLIFLAFLGGAAACSALVNFSRRRDRESQFAVPLLLEAVSLFLVGLLADRHMTAAQTLGVLGFAMGLQNAIITKISDAEIRTTHVTGMVTDIGIELGRGLYWNRSRVQEPVRSRISRLATLSALVLAFFFGGLVAAVAFPHHRFAVFLPLALLLAALTIHPIYLDLKNGTES